jgi:uncharacterized protein YdhG (YjbR/CyaY superfamily)
MLAVPSTSPEETAMKQAQTRARAAAAKATQVLTAEERAAIREHVQELKSAARRGAGKADGESDLLAKIAEMPPADRALAERVHAIVRATAPDLAPRTWYGMPAYAKDGSVLCYFQSAHKFKSRYAILGFSDKANLDDGEMWPTVFALRTLTAVEEARIVALLQRAIG